MPRISELTAGKVYVAAGLLIDAEGRLLITDRLRAGVMQEFWEFPDGKLASGESAGEALHRELAEELGIEVTCCEHFHSLEYDYPGMRVAIEFFLVRSWRGTPSGIEGQALRWLKPSEISPGQLLPANAPVLELLKDL